MPEFYEPEEAPDEVDEMTDEEVFDILRKFPLSGLDGAWHPNTIALARKFNVVNFDINRWWCLTPSDWICSACGRTKEAIARVRSC